MFWPGGKIAEATSDAEASAAKSNMLWCNNRAAHAGALAAEADQGENIRNLVVHAGGALAEDLPQPVPAAGSHTMQHWLLIANEKAAAKEKKWCKGKAAAGVPFHGRSMLVDSIMQQVLDRSQKALFSV